MPRFEKPQSEYIEKVVHLNRVSKTVKGGRLRNTFRRGRWAVPEILARTRLCLLSR